MPSKCSETYATDSIAVARRSRSPPAGPRLPHVSCAYAERKESLPRLIQVTCLTPRSRTNKQLYRTAMHKLGISTTHVGPYFSPAMRAAWLTLPVLGLATASCQHMRRTCSSQHTYLHRHVRSSRVVATAPISISLAHAGCMLTAG